MGIRTDAMLIYGIPYSDIPEELQDQVDELLDEGTLDYASPWYDSSREDWIVGISIDCSGKRYVDLVNTITSDFTFPYIFQGMDLKFYVSPHVT